jgi:hypothetical protein
MPEPLSSGQEGGQPAVPGEANCTLEGSAGDFDLARFDGMCASGMDRGRRCTGSFAAGSACAAARPMGRTPPPSRIASDVTIWTAQASRAHAALSRDSSPEF